MGQHFGVRLVSMSFNEHTGVGIVEYGVRLLKSLKAKKSDAKFYGVSLANGNLTNTPKDLYKKKPNEKIKNPDLSHYLDPGFVVKDALFFARFHKDKYIVTVHDLDFLNRNYDSWKMLNQYTDPRTSLRMFVPFITWPFASALRWYGVKSMMKSTKRIVCVSEKTRDEIVRKFHIPQKMCPIVYPIISDEFEPIPKKEHSKIIIGHISSYMPNKNVGSLIKAFKMTKSKNLELRLYGQPPPFRIDDDKRIKYKGFVSTRKLPSIFNSFDVFVFPSTWEGFGMPIMEAKKCKVPVITYKKGHITDIVKRHTLQFSHEEDLAKMLENQEWRGVDVEKAYNDVKKCSSDYVAKRMIKIYKEVLNGK